jgi:hypothetical protein
MSMAGIMRAEARSGTECGRDSLLQDNARLYRLR